MPAADSPGKPGCRPDPSDNDMGMAWTRSGNVSAFNEFLDISPQHVHGVDMFPCGAHAVKQHRTTARSPESEGTRLVAEIRECVGALLALQSPAGLLHRIGPDKGGRWEVLE